MKNKFTFWILCTFGLLLTSSKNIIFSLEIGVLEKLEDGQSLIFEYSNSHSNIYFGEIRITRMGNFLIAKRLGDTIFVGGIPEVNWEQKIEEKEKILIEEFAKAIDESNNCKSIGGGMEFQENYWVKIDDQLLYESTGICEQKVQYFKLFEEMLFKEDFQRLEIKKTKLEKKLNNTIRGNWFPNISIPELEANKSKNVNLVLTRNFDSQKSISPNCFITFQPVEKQEKKELYPHKFRSECKEMDLQYSYGYQWYLDRRVIDLEISGGFIKNERGNIEVANYGALLTVNSLSKDKIELTLNWR